MAEDDLFAAPIGDADDDMFGAAVEDVDAADAADDGDDMFGAAVEDISADVAATDEVDDMFGGPTEGAGDGSYGGDAGGDAYGGGGDASYGGDAGGDASYGGDAEVAPPEPEPEPVQESARIVWSRKFRAIIDERATEERKLLLERKEKAAAELKEYMERREEHKISTAARNRQEESDFLIQIAEEKDNANPWSRVVNMIETQAHGDENRTDPKRLRSVLIQLKNKPLKKEKEPDECTL